jgi:hypothetical protein
MCAVGCDQLLHVVAYALEIDLGQGRGVSRRQNSDRNFADGFCCVHLSHRVRD